MPEITLPEIGENNWGTKLSAAVTEVNEAVDLAAPKASPAFTGNPTAPTQTAGNNSTRVATTAFVTTAVAAGSATTITGTYAARPTAAAAGAGVMYVATNVPEMYLSNGTTWAVVGSGGNELGSATLAAGTAPTTTSGAAVDVPGLSVTFVAGERPVELRFMGDVNNSGVNVTVVYFTLADNVVIQSSGYKPFAAANPQTIYAMARRSGLTAGTTYTAKVRFAVGAGTGTVGSAFTPTTFQVVTL